MPLPQLAALARALYARHADAYWHKWTAAEAAALFAGAGLIVEFWSLESRAGTF